MWHKSWSMCHILNINWEDFWVSIFMHWALHMQSNTCQWLIVSKASKKRSIGRYNVRPFESSYDEFYRRERKKDVDARREEERRGDKKWRPENLILAKTKMSFWNQVRKWRCTGAPCWVGIKDKVTQISFQWDQQPNDYWIKFGKFHPVVSIKEYTNECRALIIKSILLLLGRWLYIIK